MRHRELEQKLLALGFERTQRKDHYLYRRGDLQTMLSHGYQTRTITDKVLRVINRAEREDEVFKSAHVIIRKKPEEPVLAYTTERPKEEETLVLETEKEEVMAKKERKISELSPEEKKVVDEEILRGTAPREIADALDLDLISVQNRRNNLRNGAYTDARRPSPQAAATPPPQPLVEPVMQATSPVIEPVMQATSPVIEPVMQVERVPTELRIDITGDSVIITIPKKDLSRKLLASLLE